MCSESILERDLQKNYHNVIIEITKNDFKTTFNFLIDLDLIKEILNTGIYKPTDCQLEVSYSTASFGNVSIENKFIASNNRLSLVDVTNYLQPLGSRLLRFFNKATPAVTASEQATPDFAVDYLDDANESNIAPKIDCSEDDIELDLICVSTVSGTKNVFQVVMEALENANLLTQSMKLCY